jgi:transitional endoplasmic reticulum ATPase
MFRLAKDLRYSINKSNQLLFLTGENIYDTFYNDFYYGTLTLRDSLYYFFRKEFKCDISMYIDINLNLNCFNKKTYSALDEYFYNKEQNLEILEDSVIPGVDLDIIKHSANEGTLLKKKRNPAGPVIERISQLDNFFLNSKGKKFLLIESFEWIAELFNFHMHNYEILRIIHKWFTTPVKNLYVVVLLKDPELLTHYYFDTDSDNFLVVPGARPDEYFNAFYRHMFLNYDTNLHLEKMHNLATAFKTNNFKLKEAVSIFAKELNIHSAEKQSFFKLYPEFNKYFNTPIEEKIDFDNDLILEQEIKDRLKTEFRNFIENKPEAKKGIILTGSPGTGKTLIAKSIATLGGFNFMSLKLSDLKQLYVGHSGAEVKKIFDKARSLEPTIMFIDEMDAVFPKRDNMQTDSFAKDMTNEFIAQVDGVDTGKQRVFIIGATNIAEVLDSAVISRFDMQSIPLPRKPEREKLFELYISSLRENNWGKLNKHIFLDKTEGLSGRDIKEISNTIKSKISDTTIKNASKDIFDIALEIFKEKVISTNRDKFEYVSFKKNKYNFNSIIGYTGIKKEIRSAVASVIKAAELRYYNIEAERGILLEGPPGNGKSYVAKCVAGEFNLDFIKVLGKDIATHFYSEDSKKLSDIFTASFKIARLSKNGCVLFFDEFDGIASKNSNLNLRATMLDLIIKSREIPNLILMAATNDKSLLDDATIRDGRFDRKIRINNPGSSDIFDLVRDFLKEIDKISNKNKIDNKITNDVYEKILKYFASQKNTSSSSIAGIKVFTNNLKRQAFFNKKVDKDKRLVLDDEIVLEYLNSLQ